MSYADRWLLAVAMKQPYPSETGATQLTLFSTTQQEHDTQTRAIWTSAGAALGMFTLAWLFAPKASP